jgi:hypothetical protein
MTLTEGTVLGRYRLLERLGEGGMGVVWRAEDTELGRHAALKFLPAHLSRAEDARERLLAEARAAAKLDHPIVCMVYGVGETDEGGIYIAMACYDGVSLKQKLEGGPLPAEAARDLAAQIARGLGAAHARGIVHRDVKPSNVIVTEGGVAKLVDFGIAKMAGVEMTRTGVSLGTLEYMAPEQARSEADPRTDVWALGVVLYEMLTGRRPFKGAYDGAVLFDLLYNEPDFAALEHAGVPAALVAVVRRCLRKDPNERYATAEALARDLDAAKAAPAGGPTAIAPEPASLIVVAAASAPLDALPPAPASVPAPPPGAALVEVAPPPDPAPAAADRPAKPAGARGASVPIYVLVAMGTVLVVASAALLLASRDPEGAAPALLSLTTTPPGAAVYLDGRHVGITPLERLDVAPGEVAVALRLDGFAAVDTTLEFEPGAPAALALTLAPAAGLTEEEALAMAEEAAQSEQEGAGVPAVGEPEPPQETTPPAPPPPSQEERPPPRPEPSRPEPSRPEPEPEPAALQMGTLVLGVEPSGSATVAGRSGGTVAVPAGRHTVTFRSPRYGQHQVTVNVAPGETQRLTCYFEARVRVAARLEGADGPAPTAAVTVDGQNAGFTPTTLTLGPGTHRVAVSRTGFQVLDGPQAVTIAPSLEPVTRSLSFRLAPQ